VRIGSFRNAFACIVAGCATASALVLGGVLLPSNAYAVTSEELQAELDEATAHLNELMAETEESIASLEETQATIDGIQQDIDETIAALDEKAIEVEGIKEDLATIIANDYKTQGNLGLIGFVLGATDYEDFVSRIYYVGRVSEQKQRSLEELSLAQDELLTIRQDLESKSVELQELATQQRNQVNDLQAAVDSQQAYVNALPAEIQRALEEEYAASLASAQAEAESLLEDGEGEAPESGRSSNEDQDEGSAQQSSNSGSEGSGDSGSSQKPSTPQSQQPESSGGSLADVANYIGPQASWSSDANYIASQQRLLNAAGSSTSWGCVVDKGYGRCTVFRRDGGTWKAAMTTDVITNGHTFTGTFSVVFHARWYWQDGYNVNDWWVCFIAAWTSDNYSGHLRYVPGKGYDDGQGFHYGYSTGGCTVIPSMSTSQWLYDHVPDGSRVIVH